MQNKRDTSSPYWVWGLDKVVYGPVDLPLLVKWSRQRRVTAETWIFQDKSGSWSRADAVSELKPLFDPLHSRPGHVASAISSGVVPDVMLHVKVLAGLNGPQLQSFLSYMEILTLEPMISAVREGERGDAMYLILEGELRARLVRNGRETILATLKAGDFFGEISLLDQGPRSADVIANERSTLLKISTDAFGKLRREAPALAEPFMHALAQMLVGRLRGVDKRYVDSLSMLQALAVEQVKPRLVWTRHPAIPHLASEIGPAQFLRLLLRTRSCRSVTTNSVTAVSGITK